MDPSQPYSHALPAFGLDSESWGVNVEPYLCTSTNFVVYTGFLLPKDRIMGLESPSGGHVNHGYHIPGGKQISGPSILFESTKHSQVEEHKITIGLLASQAQNTPRLRSTRSPSARWRHPCSRRHPLSSPFPQPTSLYLCPSSPISSTSSAVEPPLARIIGTPPSSANTLQPSSPPQLTMSAFPISNTTSRWWQRTTRPHGCSSAQAASGRSYPPAASSTRAPTASPDPTLATLATTATRCSPLSPPPLPHRRRSFTARCLELVASSP